MKIFLTGGTGFVGSHFLRVALAGGHEVIAQRRCPESRPRLWLEREPSWLDVPLDAIEAEHLGGCDCVVHLAAHTANVPYDSFGNCFYWNVQAVIRLFEKAIKAGVEKWIVAGSSFEYGTSAERYEFIPVTAPLAPVGSYPASKAAASVALRGLGAQFGCRLLIGRIFQVYGEGESASRLWPSLREAALSGGDLPMTAGEQIRDFISVEEVAAYFLRAAEANELEPGSPVIENVGSGRPESIRNFAEHWWAHWGAKGRLLIGEVPYRENEVMRYVPEVRGV
ncbi:MAG: NAD-dependent epimerase/dehydratase family protein [Verrucomicrobiota bacterium]